MKRQSFAVLALAAMMAVGASGITALAAEGWAQEGYGWVYYDASGNRVYNAWRQGGDGLWRYLNSSGVMAVDTWVDDDNYYVDANGIMLSNRWMQIANVDKAGGYDWYYFTQSGKVVKGEWEKVNNKWYHFSDDGVMETGWILEDMYYCGDDGAMVTGWQRLIPADENDDDYYKDHSGPYEDVDDGKYWYYFTNNGKKVIPKENDDGELATKKINGVTYALAEDGSVRTGWVCMAGEESDEIADYRYVDSNGQLRVGWYSVEPPEHLMNNYEHDVEWFYFDKKGVPEVGPRKGAAKHTDLKRINGNTYLFDENGTPVYGLQKVYTDSDESEYSAYFFGTRNQSAMLKGKHRVDEGTDSVMYYFASNGRGFTGVYENCLYYMGKLQRASSGSKYEVFTIYSGNTPKNYVVNTSGRIAKNTTVRDSGGTKYKTNSGGILVLEDGEEVDGKTYSSPEEPEWDYN